MRVKQTRRIMVLAWPIVISMLSYTAMDLADALFVGWLGTTELAAVGLAATLLFMIQSFFLGTLQGVSIGAAQAEGARDLDRARRIAQMGILLAIPFGLFVLAIALLREPLFLAMGGEPEVQRIAADYFKIRAFGVPFLLVMFAICNYYQGIGKTRVAMYFNLFANGLNILLDPILIFGFGAIPAMGVEGAALATVIAQFLGMVAAILFFVWNQGLRKEFDLQQARRILTLGLPLGLRFFLSMTGFTIFTALIARLGTTELAAHQIALRVVSVSFLPGHGIAQAAGILTGQRVGARELEMVREVLFAGLQVAWVLMGIMGVFFFLFGTEIASLFVDSEETIRLAAQLLIVAAAIQLLDATVMVLIQTLNGTGDTRFTAIAAIGANWCVLLPTAYLLAVVFELGAPGAWMAIGVEFAVLASIMIWRFSSRRWHRYALSPTS